MKNKKPADFFTLTSLTRMGLGHLEIVQKRPPEEINAGIMLPLGSVVYFKKEHSTWVIIDYDEKDYMLARADYDPTKHWALQTPGPKQTKYCSFEARAIPVDHMNLALGIDLKRGTIPVNPELTLMNIQVGLHHSNFFYSVTPICLGLLRLFGPNIIYLMESIFVGFKTKHQSQLTETRWAGEFYSEEALSYTIVVTQNGQVISEESTFFKRALLHYSFKLKRTGDFISKKAKSNLNAS